MISMTINRFLIEAIVVFDEFWCVWCIWWFSLTGSRSRSISVASSLGRLDVAHLFTSSGACSGKCTHVRPISGHTLRSRAHTRASPFSRLLGAAHSIPLGHFRPGQAPPTFILITSWFAPASLLPVFLAGERFSLADAWEPHLCRWLIHVLLLPTLPSPPSTLLSSNTERIGKLDDSVVNGRCTEAMRCDAKLRALALYTT